MPLHTTIARACPPILFSAITCSWKWSTMISALSRIAWSWLSTYCRSFFFAFFVSNSGSSSIFFDQLVVAVHRRVALEHVEDEALLDGLLHRVAVKGPCLILPSASGGTARRTFPASCSSASR